VLLDSQVDGPGLRSVKVLDVPPWGPDLRARTTRQKGGGPQLREAGVAKLNFHERKHRAVLFQRVLPTEGHATEHEELLIPNRELPVFDIRHGAF
jgi:hypothetical protein